MEPAALSPTQCAGRTGLLRYPGAVSLASQNDFVGAAPRSAGVWMGLVGPCCVSGVCQGTGSNVPQPGLAPSSPSPASGL